MADVQPLPAASPSPTKRPTSARPTTTTKRPSSALPRAPCTIHPTAVVANHAVLTGKHMISIAENAILQPYAKVDSTVCAVEIGRGVLVGEKAVIGVIAGGGGEGGRQEKVILERNVLVENGAVVQAVRVGEGTVVQSDARVGAGVVVGRNCKICALEVVPPNAHLPDCTVVYGNGRRRVDTTALADPEISALKMVGHELHLGVLAKLIPSNAAKWQ